MIASCLILVKRFLERVSPKHALTQTRISDSWDTHTLGYGLFLEGYLKCQTQAIIQIKNKANDPPDQ